MKKILLIMISLFITQLALANCPDVKDVTYHCYGEHCAWEAPGYSDTFGTKGEPGTHPRKFSYVFWTTQEGRNQEPGVKGLTMCVYQSNEGDIELWNLNWDSVLYPEGNQWTKGYWRGDYVGMICEDNLIACGYY